MLNERSENRKKSRGGWRRIKAEKVLRNAKNKKFNSKKS
jgi:hypothetical protein